MKAIWNWIQIGFASLGAFLGWFFGGFDGLIYTLIAFVAVDYITGVLRAIVEKKLSSRIGARGIVKKVAIFLIVGIAHLADVYLLGGVGSPGDGNALRTAVIFFYISNEGISILENAVVIKLPVPQILRDTLTQIKNKSGNDGKDGDNK